MAHPPESGRTTINTKGFTGSMGLFAELKRRSVFKVGAAYLVVGWLVIQVAVTVGPQLALPDWAPRFITFVILLGFPVALVLAWTLDVTPEGVRIETASRGNKMLRTSSFAFKGQQKEIPAIARELNVRMVLEGSVRKQDDRVRITAQHVDAHSRPARHNAVTRHN